MVLNISLWVLYLVYKEFAKKIPTKYPIKLAVPIKPICVVFKSKLSCIFGRTIPKANLPKPKQPKITKNEAIITFM